ncbi:hypothetical protein J6590_029756 [Homalodisca vitripennis]|nr:hypothetical protein J6590_029756 [Homalodisca vitripennis]
MIFIAPDGVSCMEAEFYAQNSCNKLSLSYNLTPAGGGISSRVVDSTAIIAAPEVPLHLCRSCTLRVHTSSPSPHQSTCSCSTEIITEVGLEQ